MSAIVVESEKNRVSFELKSGYRALFGNHSRLSLRERTASGLVGLPFINKPSPTFRGEGVNF
jgi:hypothetical protein